VPHLRCPQPTQRRLSFQNSFANKAEAFAARQHPLGWCKHMNACCGENIHIFNVNLNTRKFKFQATYECRTNVRMENPNVGLMVSNGSPSSCFSVVVFPALSNPRNRMRNSRSLSMLHEPDNMTYTCSSVKCSAAPCARRANEMRDEISVWR